MKMISKRCLNSVKARLEMFHSLKLSEPGCILVLEDRIDEEKFLNLLNVILSFGGKYIKKPRSCFIIENYQWIYIPFILRSMGIDFYFLFEYHKFIHQKYLFFFKKKYKNSTIIKSNLNIPVPKGYKYFEFQKASVDRFIECDKRLIIADDMGLGKSISAIAIANYMSYKNIIVVTFAYLLENFKKEFEKWYLYSKNIHIFNKNSDIDTIFQSNIIFLSYSMLKKFYNKIKNEKINYDYLIIDEAHSIKETNTQRSEIIFKLKRKIKPDGIVLLTGTPILNYPYELWNLLKILDYHKYFGNSYYFLQRYCGGEIQKIKKKSFDKESGQVYYREIKIINKRDAMNVSELNFRVRQLCFLRREFKDVEHELNQILKYKRKIVVVDVPKNLQISNNERYIAMFNKFFKNPSNKIDYDIYINNLSFDVNKMTISDIAYYRIVVALEKVKFMKKYVENVLQNNNCKIVVFGHHRIVLETFHKQFPSKSVLLYGKINRKQKNELLEKFYYDDEIKIFIGSIKASYAGLNLQNANKVIFLELDWTPNVMKQCEARCLRIGQKNEVEIVYLVANRTIDEYILNVLKVKEKISEVFFNKE